MPVAQRAPLDLSVYLVTDTGLCGAVGVVETVRRAVAAGASLVQLRDPSADDSTFVALGRALVAALAGTGVPLLVNDRVDLVAAIGADGAHVGQGDMAAAAARRVLGPDAYLGLSVNTPAELCAAREAQAAGAELDYLGLGIYKPTASKLDHAPAGGLDHVAALAAASPWPTCAIGGVKAADAPALRRAGLDGMAVISAICGRPDIEAATRELVAAWAAGATSVAEPDLGGAPRPGGRSFTTDDRPAPPRWREATPVAQSHPRRARPPM